MTSLVLHPQQECAPHAIRTLAMACAIALNLTALLVALRPLPLVPVALPAAQPEINANVLEQSHPPPPPVPILNPVRHVEHTAPAPIFAKPVAIAPTIGVPDQVVTTETSTVMTPVIQQVAPPSSMTGSTDATIAYETATPPPYPIAALRAGVQGTVLLRVLVDEDGKPVQV